MFGLQERKGLLSKGLPPLRSKAVETPQVKLKMKSQDRTNGAFRLYKWYMASYFRNAITDAEEGGNQSECTSLGT